MVLTAVSTFTSMGYQALLFCPDDKTARTVTQVLSELDFTVEACIEPFAAVKKMMGQHFDAVVVDCDNEQNATLLFKSARNSTSNQTSLAVAVVEGQAGVAKAFRIGANLVLTKPINIEQAKGTLRVARGLLRKSDPTKPGSATATGTFAVPTAPTAAPTAAPAPAAASAPAPAKPAAPRPAAAARPAAPASTAPKPVSPAATATFKPPQAPGAKPAAPAWPTAAAAKSAPVVYDAPAAPVVAEKPAARPAPSAQPPLYSAVLATPVVERPAAPPAAHEPKPPVVSSPISSGAASAPAPAREPQVSKVQERLPEKSAESVVDELFEKPVGAAPASEPQAYVGAAPSFSFGGAAAESASSSGGSKRTLIGIAAVALIAAGGYFGWSHFKGGSGSAPQPVATSAPAAPSATPKSTSTPPSSPVAEPAKPSPASQPDIMLGTSGNSSREESDVSTSGAISKPSPSPPKSANSSPAPTKPPIAEKTVEANEPAAPALVVKGGKVPSVQLKAAAAPDAPAPSLIGMGVAADPGLPNLGTSNSALKPTLQTLSVSQGVSQGLLYKKVSPSYPQNALRMHIEGVVELLATISKTGEITRVKVISGDAQLTRAASEAVKQWKYKPYLLNGEPVEIQTQVTVNFKLPH